jgi:hypothetical protein
MKKVLFPRLQKQVEFVFLCKDSAWGMNNKQIAWEIWKNFYQHRSWCEFEISDNSISKAVKAVKRKLRHIDRIENEYQEDQKLCNMFDKMQTVEKARKYDELPSIAKILFAKI